MEECKMKKNLKAILNKFRNFVGSHLVDSSRYFYWKLFFKKLGKNVKIYGKIEVYGPNNITIGDNSSLNSYVYLDASNSPITIGNDVRISPNVMIFTGGLLYKTRMMNHFGKGIIIEDHVWIASGAIILSGVKIGKNSVIGAGAVVTKDIPSNSVAVGVPAKVIKKINLKEAINEV